MTYKAPPQHVGAKDGQRYDRVEIYTVNRYKQSDMSGDEWRYNSAIKFYRKGEVVHVQTFRNVEEAAQCLPALMVGVGMLDCDWDRLNAANKGKCDQEGCSDDATHYHYLKDRYDRAGNKRPARDTGEYRCFCDRHKTRGDCGLDDADVNYDVQENGVVQ